MSDGLPGDYRGDSVENGSVLNLIDITAYTQGSQGKIPTLCMPPCGYDLMARALPPFDTDTAMILRLAIT